MRVFLISAWGGLVLSVVLGLGLCLASMSAFRSAMKNFGLDAGMLTVAGPYPVE